MKLYNSPMPNMTKILLFILASAIPINCSFVLSIYLAVKFGQISFWGGYRVPWCFYFVPTLLVMLLPLLVVIQRCSKELWVRLLFYAITCGYIYFWFNVWVNAYKRA